MLGALQVQANVTAGAKEYEVNRPLGVCKLGDTGYARYSGNQYSGKLTLPINEKGNAAKYYEVNFSVIGGVLQGTSVTMGPELVHPRKAPDEVYNESTGYIAPGYVKWECNNFAKQTLLYDSGLYYIVENVPSVPYGEKGDKGERGPRGVKGQQGPQGIRGKEGQKGVQGIKGIRGPNGPRGNRGVQGNVGPRGPAGKNTVSSDEPPANLSTMAARYRYGKNGNLDTLYLPMVQNFESDTYYTVTYTVKERVLTPMLETAKGVTNSDNDKPTGINSPVDETIRIPQVLKDNKLYSAVLWSMGGEKYKLVLTKTTN